ncbi:MAG: hypothetical protein HFF36_04110 [Coprobacillus sp.]|nr:hypothetical protein [Coprobacillus sp.]
MEKTVNKIIKLLNDNEIKERKITTEDILSASERVENNYRLQNDLRFMGTDELYGLTLKEIERVRYDEKL